MKIGIDITPLTWGNKTGIGWYAYHLIKNIKNVDKKNLYILYGCFIKQYKKILKIKSDFKSENFYVSVKFFPNRIYNYAVQTILPIELFHGKFDIIHTLHPFSPVSMLGKQIITIHDLTPLINPEWFVPLHSEKFRFIISKAVKRTDLIIADSNSTKKDIVKFFNINAEKIEVIYLAADEIYKPIQEKEFIEKTKKKYGIDKKYILFVGTIEPRKNLVRLLSVFKQIKHHIKDYQLVICGQPGWKTKTFFSKLNSFPEEVKKDIILTGYVPREEQLLLYNGCELFIYPSLYEGFGLPVLEAMSCGVPVITSNISSLPEVGGDAVILVNPEDEDEIGNAIIKVLEDKNLRELLIRKGIERSKLFNWRKTAEETLKIYKKVKR